MTSNAAENSNMRTRSRWIDATGVVGILLGGIVATHAAFAQQPMSQRVWGPNAKLTIKELNCSSEKIDLILVQGEVELIHPDDKPDILPPQIFVRCDKMIFADKSKIKTRAELYILADTSISGSVDIENTRGQPGADGKDDPKIYLVRKSPNGADGAAGGGGHNALFSSIDYPGGRNAGNGGAGSPGGRGEDGKGAEAGSNGLVGSNAASVTLKTRKYSPGTTITINTRGGKGGAGSQGGRGGDGGDGGKGGKGGRGGDAAEGRTAGNGGNGGKGGDGGDGARGGPAGNGGNGGAGGDINVLILDDGTAPLGTPPTVIFAFLEGGLGGEPGQPGVGGAGGKGSKPGGVPGCGGSGAGFIKHHPDGDCGQQGDPGVDGRDGDPGPAGKFGDKGPDGKRGEKTFGYVVEKKPR